jgi:hypothetical protein
LFYRYVGILIAAFKLFIKRRSNSTKTQTEESLPVFEHGKDRYFFSARLGQAFPGWYDEIKWYSEKEAVNRLCIFFQHPIYFKYVPDEPQFSDCISYIAPLWGFRGFTSIQIEQFDQVSKGKVKLNDNHELVIGKIAVHKTRAQRFDFIYVETLPEKSVGLNKLTDKEIADCVKEFGYCWEEYALIGKTPISVESWGDGAAEINGQVVSVPSDARTKLRYLTKYNFLLISNSSPYNCPKFEAESKEFFDDVLNGRKSYQELFSWLRVFQSKAE